MSFKLCRCLYHVLYYCYFEWIFSGSLNMNIKCHFLMFVSKHWSAFLYLYSSLIKISSFSEMYDAFVHFPHSTKIPIATAQFYIFILCLFFFLNQYSISVASFKETFLNLCSKEVFQYFISSFCCL